MKQGMRKDKKTSTETMGNKRNKNIKVRDKSYKEPIKEKNSQRKLKKSETYEKYQNKFVDLLKVSKQAH